MSRKLSRADGAVSPVIAVILMVAITVVLSATVYVWVSGFGSPSGHPAKMVTLSGAGPVASNATISAGGQWKNYSVAAATPGLRYSDIAFQLQGTALPCSQDVNATDSYRVWSGAPLSCEGGAPTRNVLAGDTIEIWDAGAGTAGQPSLSGKVLRIIDAHGNAVLLQLHVG